MVGNSPPCPSFFVRPVRENAGGSSFFYVSALFFWKKTPFSRFLGQKGEMAPAPLAGPHVRRRRPGLFAPWSPWFWGGMALRGHERPVRQARLPRPFVAKCCGTGKSLKRDFFQAFCRKRAWKVIRQKRFHTFSPLLSQPVHPRDGLIFLCRKGNAGGERKRGGRRARKGGAPCPGKRGAWFPAHALAPAASGKGKRVRAVPCRPLMHAAARPVPGEHFGRSHDLFSCQMKRMESYSRCWTRSSVGRAPGS